MSRITLYLVYITNLNIFIYSQIDISWHDDDELNSEYAKRHKDHGRYKCGIRDPFKGSEGEARIVNGKSTTTKIYPWLASIVNVINIKQPTYQGGGYSGGVIISHRIILTCIHCVCNDISYIDDKEEPTCLSGPWQNQNREENQIFYIIGNMQKDSLKRLVEKDSIKKEIKVYLFKYTPEWSKVDARFKPYIQQKQLDKNKYFKNGDIAIVIDTSPNGLNLHQHKAIPICLPKLIDATFKKAPQTDVDVIFAGRGWRYSESTDDPKINSCYTNEGLVQKKGKGLATVQHIFLPCKGYERKRKDNVCIPLENGKLSQNGKRVSAFKTKSISITSTIKFFDTPSSFQIESPKNDASANKLCNDYWDKAEQALNRAKQDTQINLFEQTDSTNEPDRIVVFEKSQVIEKRKPYWDTTGSSRPRLVAVDIDWKQLLEEWEKRPSKMGVMCYNLTKLGKFGICKTEKHQYPWGFCSPSCGKTTKLSIDHYEDFEEMNAIYHEDFPKDSDAVELGNKNSLAASQE